MFLILVTGTWYGEFCEDDILYNKRWFTKEEAIDNAVNFIFKNFIGCMEYLKIEEKDIRSRLSRYKVFKFKDFEDLEYIFKLRNFT